MTSLGGAGDFDFIIGNSSLPPVGGGGGGDGGYSQFGITEISQFSNEYLLEAPTGSDGYIQPLENVLEMSESPYLMPPQLSSCQNDELSLGVLNESSNHEFGSVVPPVPIPVGGTREEFIPVGVQKGEESPQRFENSLITLNDISNYRASGLDWIEGGASNWLSFDQSANFGESEMSTIINESTTPSLCTSSSMYNFYDEEEDECQKEIEGMEVDGKDNTAHSASVQNLGHINTGDDDEKEIDDDENDWLGASDEENENSVQINTTLNGKVVKPRSFRTESCSLCNIEFPSPGKFENHMKNVHQELHPYPCSSCDKKFAKKHQLEAHEDIHDPDRYNKEPRWECDYCERKFHVRCSLYTHYKKSHPGLKPLKPHEKEMMKKKKRNISNSLQRQCPGVRVKKTLQKLMRNQKRKPVVTTTQPVDGDTNLENDDKFVQEEMPPLSPQEVVAPTTLLNDELAVPTEAASDSRPGHYPCKICDKVFTIPSSLREHFLLHSGEKPWKCPYDCPESFRIKQTLTYHIQRFHTTKQDKKNILKLYKCRICGRDDFHIFQQLHSHRTRQHKEVPYDKEKEKTFGCGTCLKPYFLREDAIVCALLAHDATHLRETMFRFKCPKCPEDRLGYYKQALLKKHMEDEHQEKGNLEDCTVTWESLPYVRVNKVKAAKMRESGLPPGVAFDCPLYYDLTECGPSEKEQHLMASLILKILSERPGMDGPQVCTICGKELSNKGNFKRHLSTVHISEEILKKEQEEKELEIPSTEEERRQQNENMKKPVVIKAAIAAPSEKEVDNIFEAVLSKKRIQGEMESDEEDGDGGNVSDKEEEQLQPVISSFQCKFCDKTFPKRRALQFHEVRGHLNPKKSKPEPVKSTRPARNSPSVKNTRTTTKNSPLVKNTRTTAKYTPPVKNTRPVKRSSRPTKKKVSFLLSSSSSSSCSSMSMDEKDDSDDDDSLFEAVVKDQEKLNVCRTTVNVNDTEAVKSLLNNQTVNVVLCRAKIDAFSVKEPDNIATAMKKEAAKIIQPKKLKKKEASEVIKPKELKKKNVELPPFEPVVIEREKKTENYRTAAAVDSSTQRQPQHEQLINGTGAGRNNNASDEEDDEIQILDVFPAPKRIAVATKRKSSLDVLGTQKQQQCHRPRNDNNSLLVNDKTPKIVLRRIRLADDDDFDDGDVKLL